MVGAPRPGGTGLPCHGTGLGKKWTKCLSERKNPACNTTNGLRAFWNNASSV